MDKYLGDGLLAVFDCESSPALRPGGAATLQPPSARRCSTSTRSLDRGRRPSRSASVSAAPWRSGSGRDRQPRIMLRAPSSATASMPQAGLEAETKGLGVELLVSAPLLEAAGYHSAPDLTLQTFQLRGVSQASVARCTLPHAALSRTLAGGVRPMDPKRETPVSCTGPRRQPSCTTLHESKQPCHPRPLRPCNAGRKPPLPVQFTTLHSAANRHMCSRVNILLSFSVLSAARDRNQHP